LVLGWQRFASGETFTFSILVMAFMLCAGALGAALGSWLCLGYAVGDFFLFRHCMIGVAPFWQAPMSVFLRVGMPAILLYLLLANLIVAMPLLSQAMRLQVRPLIYRLPLVGRMLAEALLLAFMQALIVYGWVQVVPPLIRPVYTWTGNVPPTGAMVPLQSHGLLLVWLASGLGALRVYMEYKALRSPSVVARVRDFATCLAALGPVRRLRLPPLITSIFRAALISFVLAGLLTSWAEALVFTAAAAAIFFGRERLVASQFGKAWTECVVRAPLIVRFVAGILISYFLGTTAVAPLWSTAQSFRPLLVSVAVSLGVFAFLLPPLAPATVGPGNATERGTRT
jgi:hypothetical protein